MRVCQNLIPESEEIASKMRREVRRWLPVWLVAAFVGGVFISICQIQAHRILMDCHQASSALDQLRRDQETNDRANQKIELIRTRLESVQNRLVQVEPLGVLKLILDAVEASEKRTQVDALSVQTDDAKQLLRVAISCSASSAKDTHSFVQFIMNSPQVTDCRLKGRQAGNAVTKESFTLEFLLAITSQTGDSL